MMTEICFLLEFMFGKRLAVPEEKRNMAITGNKESKIRVAPH